MPINKKTAASRVPKAPAGRSKPEASSAKPRKNGAASSPSRPLAKRRDEAKEAAAKNRTVDKAKRDAIARHAKMLEALARRKAAGSGRMPPIPTLEEFVGAFVSERLHKSEERKKRQNAPKPAKPGR